MSAQVRSTIFDTLNGALHRSWNVGSRREVEGKAQCIPTERHIDHNQLLCTVVDLCVRFEGVNEDECTDRFR